MNVDNISGNHIAALVEALKRKQLKKYMPVEQPQEPVVEAEDGMDEGTLSELEALLANSEGEEELEEEEME